MSFKRKAPIAVEELQLSTLHSESKTDSNSAANAVSELDIVSAASGTNLHIPVDISNSNSVTISDRYLHDHEKDDEDDEENARVDAFLDEIDYKKSEETAATLDDKSYDNLDESEISSVHDSEESVSDPPLPKGVLQRGFKAIDDCSSGTSNRR